MNKTNTWLLLSLSIYALGAAGCAKKADPAATAPGELEGTWASPCDDSSTPTNRQSFTFTGSSWTSTMSIYTAGAAGGMGGSGAADTDCSTTPILKLSQSGTFEIGAVVTGLATRATGAKALNLTQIAAAMLPTTSEGTAMGTAFLGGTNCTPNLTGIATNVSTSLLGENCGGTGSFPAAGAIQYNLFLITGAYVNFANFDATFDGSTLAKRPTDLNEGNAKNNFTKL